MPRPMLPGVLGMLRRMRALPGAHALRIAAMEGAGGDGEHQRAGLRDGFERGQFVFRICGFSATTQARARTVSMLATAGNSAT